VLKKGEKVVEPCPSSDEHREIPDPKDFASGGALGEFLPEHSDGRMDEGGRLSNYFYFVNLF
jgi:hypothetical protein